MDYCYEVVRTSLEVEDGETNAVQYRVGTLSSYTEAVMVFAYVDMQPGDVIILYSVLAKGKRREIMRRCI